jgi:LysR family glycine cleavage system transcriptional activator
MAGDHPLTDPEQLRHHTLLHDTTRDGWAAWATMTGTKGLDTQKGPLFNDHNVLLQAAIDGLGVALARKRLIESDIISARLVAPFPLTLPSEVAYYIVYPPAVATDAKIDFFRQWLLDEAREEGRGDR